MAAADVASKKRKGTCEAFAYVMLCLFLSLTICSRIRDCAQGKEAQKVG